MKVIYTDELGRTCLMTIADGHDIDEVIAKDVPPGVEFFKIPASDVPVGDELRDGWKIENGKISHDINKCREVKKNILRRERYPLLQAQDVEYMRAMEAGKDTSSIATEKQRLRDITKLVDAATTVDEIRAIKC